MRLAAAALLALVLLLAPAAAQAGGHGDPAGAVAAKKKKRGCKAKKTKRARRYCVRRKRCMRKRTRRKRRACIRRLKRQFRRKKPAAKQPSGGSGGGGNGGGSGGGLPGGTPTTPLPRSVSVASREFYFTLSRPAVGPGSVRMELRNVGEDPHNLVVSPDDGTHFPLVQFTEREPGEYETRYPTLSKGRYYLWCSLEGHEALGMHVTLQVK